MTCIYTYMTGNIFIYMKTLMCVDHKIEAISTQL